MQEQDFEVLLEEARLALESSDKDRIDAALKKLNEATRQGLSDFAFEEAAILKALLSSKLSGVSKDKAVIGFGMLTLIGALLILIGSSNVVE